MKKLLLVLVSCVSISVNAQNNQQIDSSQFKAEIKFEETLHDFGNIQEGTLAAYEFIFTNTGKAPLVLSNVQPSCGCTSPEWSKEPVAPGAKGKVKAVYNSYGRPGNFQKYITVKSNAANTQVDLTIKGTVLSKPVEPVSPVRNPVN
ncbi:MAG: DUF1573 domain-containing protein [Bacteroidia bacterium]